MKTTFSFYLGVFLCLFQIVACGPETDKSSENQPFLPFEKKDRFDQKKPEDKSPPTDNSGDSEEFFPDLGENPGPLRDITFAELKRFLKQDQVDKKQYIRGTFDCKHFAKELLLSARRKGIRAAFVFIEFEGDPIGHALNAFETTDSGLIYVEPQGDGVAYLELGKGYGTISINAIKSSFQSCRPWSNNDPDIAVTKSEFSGRLFDYDYFDYWLKRDKCREGLLTLYNSQMGTRNQLVFEMNKDWWSYKSQEQQLLRMDALLNQWSGYLNTFNQELGPTITIGELGKRVSAISVHWNKIPRFLDW